MYIYYLLGVRMSVAFDRNVDKNGTGKAAQQVFF